MVIGDDHDHDHHNGFDDHEEYHPLCNTNFDEIEDDSTYKGSVLREIWVLSSLSSMSSLITMIILP